LYVVSPGQVAHVQHRIVMATRVEAIRKDVSVAGSALIRQRERLVMQQQVRDRSGHGR